MPDQRIGMDESGKGDFFGPLVVAAVFVTPGQFPALEGVKEAKKLKDEACLALDEAIRAICPHAVVPISPPKYNELYAKVRNLNTLLAWGQARALENILGQVACRVVASDRFADFEGLTRHLGEKSLTATLEPKVNAQNDLAVAAASVVARAEYIRRLRLLGEKAGLTFPKGANWNAVETGADVVRKFGKDGLREVAKTHFKTLQQVLKKARSA